jgi:hypothetical protein
MAKGGSEEGVTALAPGVRVWVPDAVEGWISAEVRPPHYRGPIITLAVCAKRTGVLVPPRHRGPVTL